jgi:hypothetical protein
MRVLFLSTSKNLVSSTDITSQVLGVYLDQNARGIQFDGHELLSNIQNIKPGRNDAAEYQILVSQLLQEVFDSSLSAPRLEVTNISGTSRYDIVFFNRAERGFWHDIKLNWGNNLVIFDAKNKLQLKPPDADQMLRYSSPWRGRVLFIVCRTSQSKGFALRAAEYLKEHKICILVITDNDLAIMFTMKQQGNDPTLIVEKLYRERLQN